MVQTSEVSRALGLDAIAFTSRRGDPATSARQWFATAAAAAIPSNSAKVCGDSVN
jgi:hypothetical protein